MRWLLSLELLQGVALPTMEERNTLALFRRISRIGPETAKTALAAGGMLAAFGVASCCALPIALSVLGISAASLVGIGYLAAQYQRELLYAAVACLSAAGWVMWRQRHAQSCASGAVCPHPIAGRASSIAFGLGLALLGLTFWYETPI
jgi:mercuric ion transport protein